jgi:hypothetical protein
MGEQIVHLVQVTFGALILSRKDLLDEMTFWWTQGRAADREGNRRAAIDWFAGTLRAGPTVRSDSDSGGSPNA